MYLTNSIWHSLHVSLSLLFADCRQLAKLYFRYFSLLVCCMITSLVLISFYQSMRHSGQKYRTKVVPYVVGPVFRILRIRKFLDLPDSLVRGIRIRIRPSSSKIVRNPLISTVLWLIIAFYLWRLMQMDFQKVISNKTWKKIIFLVGILKFTDEKSRIRIR